MIVTLYLNISGWTSMTPKEPEVLAMVFVPPERYLHGGVECFGLHGLPVHPSPAPWWITADLSLMLPRAVQMPFELEY